MIENQEQIGHLIYGSIPKGPLPWKAAGGQASETLPVPQTLDSDPSVVISIFSPVVSSYSATILWDETKGELMSLVSAKELAGMDCSTGLIPGAFLLPSWFLTAEHQTLPGKVLTWECGLPMYAPEKKKTRLFK